MTWVVGAASLLGGYGVMVSDTQVTFGDGRTVELVRKSYPVGPWFAGGFAGSVQIGFSLLKSISRFLVLPAKAHANSAWDPIYVAENWAPIARQIFESAAAEEQALGAQFLLIGPHPTEDIVMPGRALPYVCKFDFPAFQPEIQSGQFAVSIGSGADVPEYRSGIASALEFDSGMLQAEVGPMGGWAQALNIAITTMLEVTPVSGIGPHVHMHIVERGQIKVATNDRTLLPSDGEPVEIRMPRVAQSWDELLQFAQEIGANALTARC